MIFCEEKNDASVRLQVTTAKLVRDDSGGWVRFDDAEALAAEVRELRRDRARLDWLGQPTRILTVFDSGSHMTADRGEILTRTSLRDLIDAAMGGGEKLDGE